jgi:hypothetical protein
MQELQQVTPLQTENVEGTISAPKKMGNVNTSRKSSFRKKS